MFSSRTVLTGSVAIIVLAALSGGCQKERAGALPARYAVLRFENLTGDPALEWIGRAASEVLSRRLYGALDGPVVPPLSLRRTGLAMGPRPVSAPGESSERSASLLIGATHIITGYWERAGPLLRLTALEEEPASGKTIRQISVEADKAIDAIDQMALQFSARAAPYPSSNATAIQVYASALENADAGALLQKSLQLSPKLGPAWITLVNWTAAKSGRQAAEQVLAQSAQVGLDPIDRANLDWEAANLSGDRALQLQTLRKLAKLELGDPGYLRTLAEREMAAGSFADAASAWDQLTQASPADPENWNNLGYAFAYAGNNVRAVAAMQQYVKLKPDEANPLDSLGDIHYLFRNYKEAAANYLTAHSKQPEALNGGEMYKAAWAQFLAGDQQQADNTFEKFRADQEKRKNPSLALLKADYLYRTNRSAQAHATLEQAMSSGNDASRSLFAAQRAIWYVLEGQREKAYRMISSTPMANNSVVASAFFVSRPSGPPSEWKALADRMFPIATAGTFHDTALAYALMMDGHKPEALPIWDKLVALNTTPDFFGLAVKAKLEGKPVERPLLPNPVQYNEFVALADRL